MARKRLPDVADQLKEAIKESGMSATDLANLADVPIPSLTRFINGQRSLTLSVAAKLCRALGLRLCKEDS